MKRVLISALLALLFFSAAAQAGHPWLEKQDSATRAMLEQYGATEEYLNMQDKMDEIMTVSEQAEQDERRAQLIIIGISLLAALWPVASGIRMLSRTEERTRGGMLAAIGILLLGVGILFAFNYGTLMLRHKEPELFNLILTLGIVIAIAVLAIVLLRKNPKK